MKPFIVGELKRDPEKIKSYFKQVGKSIIVKENISVIFPKRFENKKLAFMGDEVKVLNIFAIVDEHGNYGVANAPIMSNLSPSMTDEVDVDGNVQTVLKFNKNEVFCNNVSTLRQNTFIYDLFDEFFIQGNVPWYLNYEDLSNILIKSKKYANSNIGNSPLGMEILTSIAARIKEDKTILFRTKSKDFNKMKKLTPEYVALLNIYYTFTSTISKVAGSYFKDSVTSALVNPEKESTKVEEVLKA